MLHSLMIISGRGGIVLFRKVFTKSLQQPRLIAGLVTALCEFSTNSLGQPAAHIELETTTVTIIEQPVDILDSSGETLRAVVFHDTEDPDLYGQVIGTQLLNVFKQEFGERLLSMQLANVQGVEEIFRGFNSRIRTVMAESVEPLMHLCKYARLQFMRHITKELTTTCSRSRCGCAICVFGETSDGWCG